MKGRGPVRAHLELPAHEEDEEANKASRRPGMYARAERSEGGGSDPVPGPRKTGRYAPD